MENCESLPAVILGVEKEVCTDDGDTNRDDHQYYQHQQHKPIHVIDLIRPERREDEIPANIHTPHFRN